MLLFDRSREGKLHSGPEEILFWIINLKVTVIDEIIAIKTKAELKADQPNTVDQEALVPRVEQVGSGLQVPVHGSAKKIGPKENFLRVHHLFPKGIAARAEAVADIVEQEAGFHCIQVNEADGLFFICGEEEIGHFRVSMNDLLAYAPMFAGILQKKGVLPVLLNKTSTILDLRILRSKAHPIILGKIERRVVKTG